VCVCVCAEPNTFEEADTFKSYHRDKADDKAEGKHTPALTH
jgi:hypothetical protein